MLKVGLTVIALRALGLALPFAAFIEGAAHALCLQPSPVRVCTEFYRSENVVVARVASKRQIPVTPDPANIEGWYYKLQTVKSYRGPRLPNDEVYTGNDDSMFPMEVGQIYLLFINKNLEGRPVPDACGNSAGADKAGNAVTAIETIEKAVRTKGGGDIGGQVFRAIPRTEAISDTGVANVTLTVRDSGGKTQTAQTDEQGRFDIHVAAGQYSVTGADPSDKFQVAPFPLGYMSPAGFDIADGGCADLVFSDGLK